MVENVWFGLSRQVRAVVQKRIAAETRYLAGTLTPANQVVERIKTLLAEGRRVATVDFALGRFVKDLRAAGISEKAIAQLQQDNFDHHDGNNPGKTATEVVFENISERASLTRATRRIAVIADQVIDPDNVLATFAAQNPEMALHHREVVTALTNSISSHP
ncbi:hypothetical protein HZB07_00315 [Candidatus Saganbacteria bacterium]|nr:hypothetical protein [Candidatus Saganbacteria bacterium]